MWFLKFNSVLSALSVITILPRQFNLSCWTWLTLSLNHLLLDLGGNTLNISIIKLKSFNSKVYTVDINFSRRGKIALPAKSFCLSKKLFINWKFSLLQRNPSSRCKMPELASSAWLQDTPWISDDTVFIPYPRYIVVLWYMILAVFYIKVYSSALIQDIACILYPRYIVVIWYRILAIFYIQGI